MENNTNNLNENQNSNNVETNAVENKKKNFSIAALVLGIVALVLSCIWYISIPCAILAIIFGVLGLKSSKRGMSVAGITTGAIGMVLSILLIVSVFLFGFAILKNATDELTNNDYNYYLDDSNF
ncbi:MAG: DUF4190 domain-containing protein [Clostridia bacterium]|jgi:hypothetical protein